MDGAQCVPHCERVSQATNGACTTATATLETHAHERCVQMTAVAPVTDDEPPPWPEAALYLALAAASTFEDQHGRKPGETAQTRDSAWEHDVPLLQALTQVCPRAQLQESRSG